MPNSDNTHGTYNKQTVIYSQVDDGSTTWTVFSNVDEGKAFFLSTELQTIHNECCTNLQYGLKADANGDNTILKVTFDFGTKGGASQVAADDWAEQFNTRKDALSTPPNMASLQTVTESDSSEHLF
jgi:hypothetical protein